MFPCDVVHSVAYIGRLELVQVQNLVAHHGGLWYMWRTHHLHVQSGTYQIDDKNKFKVVSLSFIVFKSNAALSFNKEERA